MPSAPLHPDGFPPISVELLYDPTAQIIGLRPVESRKDTAFPAAEGKLLPQVPHWKASVVGTWRPVDRVSLTAAGRYSSRNFGALDNSDVVGNVYQGFYKYFVVDLRADVRVGDHMTFALGVDNVNNDKYFLFHPFPQRSLFMQVGWKL